MRAKYLLNILECLDSVIELNEYNLLLLYSCNKENIGFIVNTNNKIIEITDYEEEQ